MAGQILTLSQSDGVAVAAPSAFSGVLSVSGGGYTILDSDGYYTIEVTTGASDRAITLPSAASNPGRHIRFKKIDSGIGGVIITGTIDGGTTNNTIKAQNGYAAVQSDGSSWYWTVDIHEYGTWTPSPLYGATPAGSITLSNRRYSRRGRAVLYMFDISFRTGGASGSFTVGGLPFTANASNSASAIGYLDNVTVATGAVVYAAVAGTVVQFFTKLHNATATVMATATQTTFANNASDMRLMNSGWFDIAQ